MSDINEKITQEYDASQIQVLEGLEAVRLRPGMYIGSTSASGLHHLVYEIVDNAIDESLAGYCDHIEVTIEPGDVICVADNGPRHPRGHTGPDGQARAGSRVHRAARRRQVRRRRIQGLRRPARRGRQRGERPLRLAGSERAQKREDLSDEVLPRRDHPGHDHRRRDGPHRHRRALPPDPEMFEETVFDYDTLHTRMREQAF